MLDFRYYHTCPDIDKNIRGFESNLEGLLSDLFSDLCPPGFIHSDEAYKLKEDYLKLISDEANVYFENVRTVNSDIRDAAEKVVKDGNDRIEELEYTIKELESKIEDLEEEINEQ